VGCLEVDPPPDEPDLKHKEYENSIYRITEKGLQFLETL